MVLFEHVHSAAAVTDCYGEIRLPLSEVARRLHCEPEDVADAVRQQRLTISVKMQPNGPVVLATAREVKRCGG